MPSISNKPLSPTAKLFQFLLAPFVFVPAFLIITALLALLIPGYPILCAITLFKRRQFIRALRKENRIIDLQNARARVQITNGTLLVEVHEKGVGDTWWIDADFSGEDCPLPLASKLSNKKNFSSVWDTLFRNPEALDWLKERTGENVAILFVQTPRHFWTTPHPEIIPSRVRLISYHAKKLLNTST